jgi:quercetin dioxygenase-like cupin family protein
MQTTHFVKKGTSAALELFGSTVEILTPPSEADAVYCVMLGTIPAGGSVPLHSHADVESFYILSGTVKVLWQRDERPEWREATRGDFVHIPGGAKHAFRNVLSEPVVQLITTTPRLGRFFREIGRPVSPGVVLPPPTPEELRRFARVSGEYGHWLGSPEENAAVGLSFFG